ncbi:amino acid ABC transporter permease [Methylobacterium planeticum]|uniref:Amino acid ABC transporter permease n=1 Tax=Methylobacterium planeticum TaxID=2615211 RepID=A0A6N6MNA8_9HYPH|nr:amino acid ABC transporter permease [Methylobacterium planeticum]KAB1070814.1 amino acid ABC transporter permease [Methylobacterium planeticum]
MNVIPDWFKSLYEAIGLNFSVFYDPYDWDRYLDGLKMTLILSVTTILLSLIIGAIGALLQTGPSRILRAFINGFVVIFRNTPPLVQIFFFYFGLGTLLPATETASGMREPLLSNTQWAIVSLSLFAAAFNVEIFRSGIEAVPKTTVEAAEALGYTRLKAYFYIILPLALRVCLPALNNNLVNLLKTTTLAYAIAVPETLYQVKQIWSESQNVFEMMVVLLATYGILVGVLVFIMHRWERSLRIPGFGQ